MIQLLGDQHPQTQAAEYIFHKYLHFPLDRIVQLIHWTTWKQQEKKLFMLIYKDSGKQKKIRRTPQLYVRVYCNLFLSAENLIFLVDIQKCN